jgi:hypothetical protein
MKTESVKTQAVNTTSSAFLFFFFFFLIHLPLLTVLSSCAVLSRKTCCRCWFICSYTLRCTLGLQVCSDALSPSCHFYVQSIARLQTDRLGTRFPGFGSSCGLFMIAHVFRYVNRKKPELIPVMLYY